tara:strand:+ start:23 stop:541 length:519 start_codon:yes stop_codon:yes gene_type:complete
MAFFRGPKVQRERDSYGEWMKIFRQDSSNSDFFSSENSWAEAKQTNTSNPDGVKYSILSSWSKFLRNGKYTLKLDYPNNSITQIWSQTSNPVDSDGSGGVDGYTAIAIDTTANGWGGLERYDTQGSTFLDGHVDHPNWYYAVGSKSWSSNTTFPGPSSPVSLVELWILNQPA